MAAPMWSTPHGRLIAHPDISLVLRNTDMSQLAQVRSARTGVAGNTAEQVQEAVDIEGHKVLTASAPVAPLGWFVFVETPIEEAYAPLYAAIERTALVLLGALALAFAPACFSRGRMVVPIQALRAGAARLGSGDLGQRIAIKTGDEVEALANQFNDMAGRLQESYADLEQKVEAAHAELTRVAGAADGNLGCAAGHLAALPAILQPVFATMLENAVRICDAKFGNIYRWDGDALHLVATHNAPPAVRRCSQAFSRIRPRSENSLSVACWRPKQLFTLPISRQSRPTLTRDPQSSQPSNLGVCGRCLAVPMLKENELIGAFTIYRQEVRPFTDKQIALVAELRRPSRHRHRECAAAQRAAPAHRRAWPLGRGAARARRSVPGGELDARSRDRALHHRRQGGAALRHRGRRDLCLRRTQREFHLRATYGMDQELIDALTQQPHRPRRAERRAGLAQREPIQVADLQEDAPIADRTRSSCAPVIARGWWRRCCAGKRSSACWWSAAARLAPSRRTPST